MFLRRIQVESFDVKPLLETAGVKVSPLTDEKGVFDYSLSHGLRHGSSFENRSDTQLKDIGAAVWMYCLGFFSVLFLGITK